MKLPVRTSSGNLRPVPQAHLEMLLSTPDWEIVGVAVFHGRVYMLVFVERKTFFQVALEVFEPANIEIPSRWRMATGVSDQLADVSLLMGHPLIASDPDLVGQLIDMDADAMARLRAALERDAQ